MTEQSTGQSLVENVTLTLSARAAMLATPVVIAIVGWFLADLIQGQREAVKDVAGHVEIVTASLSALDRRVTAIEAARQVAIDESRARSTQVFSKLDDLAKGQAEALAGMAALGAKVDALKDRMDSRPERFGLNSPPK